MHVPYSNVHDFTAIGGGSDKISIPFLQKTVLILAMITSAANTAPWKNNDELNIAGVRIKLVNTYKEWNKRKRL